VRLFWKGVLDWIFVLELCWRIFDSMKFKLSIHVDQRFLADQNFFKFKWWFGLTLSLFKPSNWCYRMPGNQINSWLSRNFKNLCWWKIS
jgi:hypothetical protein